MSDFDICVSAKQDIDRLLAVAVRESSAARVVRLGRRYDHYAQAYRAERSNWPGQGEDVEEDLPAFKQFVNNVC
eukprot:6178636-Pleurochrysis_carterae.AAC.4